MKTVLFNIFNKHSIHRKRGEKRNKKGTCRVGTHYNCVLFYIVEREE